MQKLKRFFQLLLSKAALRVFARVCFYGASLVVAFTMPKMIGVESIWTTIGLAEKQLLMVAAETYKYMELAVTWLCGSLFFEGGLFLINKLGD